MQVRSQIRAAVIAHGGYRLHDDSPIHLREFGRSLGCEELFSVDDRMPFEPLRITPRARRQWTVLRFRLFAAVGGFQARRLPGLPGRANTGT